MLRKATKKDKEQWVRLNREIAEFDVSDDNLWGQIDHAKDEELAEVFSDALSNPQQITIFMIEEEGTGDRVCQHHDHFQHMVRRSRCPRCRRKCIYGTTCKAEVSVKKQSKN